MSIRIHRAIGYGMTWGDLEATCLLPRDPQGVGEALWGRLARADDAELTVPADERRRAGLRSISEPRILAASPSFLGMREPASTGRAHELCAVVGGGDRTTHVLFFPDVQRARRWLRRDDDLDHATERWRGREGTGGDGDGSVDGADPRDFVVEAPVGHHGYEGEWMLPDGTPATPSDPWEDGGGPGRVPGVPASIRWYMGRLGILGPEGIARLRPYVAQWWR